MIQNKIDFHTQKVEMLHSKQENLGQRKENKHIEYDVFFSNSNFFSTILKMKDAFLE